MEYDVIIVGGSYAGMAAGMALGRALRKVLIIDSGHPCNEQTPHSHNFLTHDGNTPKVIAALALQQLRLYRTVDFIDDLVTSAVATDSVNATKNESDKATDALAKNNRELR